MIKVASTAQRLHLCNIAQNVPRVLTRHQHPYSSLQPILTSLLPFTIHHTLMTNHGLCSQYTHLKSGNNTPAMVNKLMINKTDRLHRLLALGLTYGFPLILVTKIRSFVLCFP